MMKRRDNSVTGINSFLMRVLVATRQTETSDYYVIRWSRSVVRYWTTSQTRCCCPMWISWFEEFLSTPWDYLINSKWLLNGGWIVSKLVVPNWMAQVEWPSKLNSSKNWMAHQIEWPSKLNSSKNWMARQTEWLTIEWLTFFFLFFIS